MHASNALFLLAASGAATASFVAERVPFGAISARSTQQGWSIQASSIPVGTIPCGNGSYCPSSLKCNTAANDEVAACCTSGDCRGSIEGAPACADSSWSLWKGLNGNGFCCAVGMVGIYDYHNAVAGTCVSSAAADATTAVLMSPGSATGAASSSSTVATSSSSMTSGTASVTSSSSSAPSTSSGSTSSAAASKTSAAAASASGSSTASATAANASTTGAKTNGAEKKIAGAFSVVALGLAAVLTL